MLIVELISAASLSDNLPRRKFHLSRSLLRANRSSRPLRGSLLANPPYFVSSLSSFTASISFQLALESFLIGELRGLEPG